MIPLTNRAVLDFLKKWKINRKHIASLIGMSPATFQHKFEQKPDYYKFNDPELLQLRQVLTEMERDLKNIKKEI